MELGSLVWFSSREHPFAVRERHCLDLECSCTDGWLTLTEVNLAGEELQGPLTFEIRVDLRTGRERRPPKRPAEIQALVREFLVRFPEERFSEMLDRHDLERTSRQRLAEQTVDPSRRGKLISYAEVIYEEEDLERDECRFGFFFVHEGRDYLIEDYYCINPACDCRKVHIGFFERIESPRNKIDIWQRFRAAFTLEGQFEEITLCEKGWRDAASVARAWREHFGERFAIFRERYEQIKAIGRRSMPSPRPVKIVKYASQEPLDASPTGIRIGRNDPCPCGSGRKFKRCCG
ncbi:MAG TPA: SEC-C metal-binding domain-containing protein [Candidatus Sulfomarinibacteraceae bacterium]|nr:SEC-C metal-binding domain-containing protein [Candidatus Sulfomarinibacteraceae bacterium]